MKKLCLALGAVSFSLMSFAQGNGNNGNAQNAGPNTTLNSFLEPSESRGYICWNPVPNATYVVNLYTKDVSGNLICVGTKSTDNNYARLTKDVFNGMDSYYSVSSFNNGNGSLIQTGDVQAYIVGGTPPDLICSRDCIGTTYAWRLQIREGNPGDTKMGLTSAIDYYDEIQDVSVPYYQAISQNVYDQMVAINHPYTHVTGYGLGPNNGPTYLYKHVQINSNTPGTFFDAQNNVVTNGWLVEKKMDQYAHMTGSSASGNPSLNNCDAAVGINTGGSWLWYYNTYVDQLTVGDPSNYQQMPNISVPTELGCNTNTPTGGNNPTEAPFPFLEPSFNDCWLLPTIQETLDCLGYTGGGGGGAGTGGTGVVVTGYEIDRLDQPGPSVVVNLDGNTPNPGQLTSLQNGLYEMRLYTSEGKVAPMIIENNTSIIVKDDRDFVKLTLTPTMVENNVLKFKISSEKNMTATLKVQSLDGQTYLSETVQLSCSVDDSREVTITSNNVPQNQIRISLIFNDGSVIQETALKVN